MIEDSIVGGEEAKELRGQEDGKFNEAYIEVIKKYGWNTFGESSNKSDTNILKEY